MPPRLPKPTRSFHAHLFQEDLEFLEDRLAGSQTRVGEAIRLIVHRRVNALRAKLTEAEDSQ